MKLEITNMTCGYGTKEIVGEITMEVQSGKVLCLLGPNGAGKTTFFKTILGFLSLMKGEITLNGRDISGFSPVELARVIGYVPQSHTPPFPYPVLEVVTMGRTAHLGLFAVPSRSDREIALEALATLNIAYLKDKPYTEISGGERQLVLIARAITQEPRILIMDEPTSNLDFGNQVRVLGRIHHLVQRGLGVIMTTHFPNHAFLAADQVAVMKEGRIYKTGSPDKVITEEILREVYGVGVKIASIHRNGADIKACIPLLEEIA